MIAHVEEPLSREDRFIRTSKRRTLAFAGAFGLWQLADLLREHTTDGAHAAWRGLSLAAWATWVVLLVAHLRIILAANKDPVLRAAMQDERAREVRLRAYQAAFWASMGAAALIGVPAASHLVPADAMAKVVMCVGISSFLVASVALDRE